MKSKFPEYYFDFKTMWQQAIFVFDANVLLNVYRLTPSASTDLLTILDGLQDRIWIPYQFAKEYHNGLHFVEKDIKSRYSQAKNKLRDIKKKALDSLKELSDPTEFNISEGQVEAVGRAIDAVSDELSGFENDHNRRLQDENIREKIAELFDGRVGKATALTDKKEIYKVGAKRYENCIPPGYKDKGKKSNPYGDLVAWFEILENAKALDKSIIMISDDSSSDDWFQISGSEVRGPRRELVDEMRTKADVDFYLYQTWELLKLAKQYLPGLGDLVQDKTIEEVRRAAFLGSVEVAIGQESWMRNRLYRSTEPVKVNEHYELEIRHFLTEEEEDAYWEEYEKHALEEDDARIEEMLYGNRVPHRPDLESANLPPWAKNRPLTADDIPF